jgi:hypothetical protein
MQEFGFEVAKSEIYKIYKIFSNESGIMSMYMMIQVTGDHEIPRKGDAHVSCKKTAPIFYDTDHSDQLPRRYSVWKPAFVLAHKHG